MTSDEFKARNKAYALRVLKLVQALPAGRSEDVVSKQLLRSATSVGANYRAACRAKSRADFIAKTGIVEEEADETVYWLEIRAESGLMLRELLADLLSEGNAIVSLVVASIRTARNKGHVCQANPSQQKLRAESVNYITDLPFLYNDDQH